MKKIGRQLKLPVLLYHHIGNPLPGSYPLLTVTPKKFAEQIKWLVKNGYQGICPSEWLAYCRKEGGLPEKPVLITFDDAYEEIVEHAFPLLHEHGFEAAVFVVTGRIGQTNDWDRQIGYTQHRLMTADQIKEWSHKGIEFGSHSRTHRKLTILLYSEMEDEITRSRKDLTKLVQQPVVSFSYPHGCYDENVRNFMSRTFPLAFTVIPGMNTVETDPLQLRRTTVLPSDTLMSFSFRVRYGRSPMDRFRRRTMRKLIAQSSSGQRPSQK